MLIKRRKQKIENTIKKLNKKYEKLDSDNSEELLKKALLKKARGFIVEEIVEESVRNEENSSLCLVKRKTTTKEIPPDMNAIKFLIEMENLSKDRYSNMTDEELRQEKLNLLKLLKEEEENGDS